MNEENEWFANWFDSPYYHLLYKNRDEGEARLFLNNLIKVLRPESGSSILDLACGKGRHAIYLAKMGYDVIGIDLSAQSIEAAKAFQKENLVFYQHDMRKKTGFGPFDYIFNLFTSFGYFDNEKDHLDTLTNSRKELKAEGKFILDFFNAKKIIKNLVRKESKEVGGTIFKIERTLESDFIVKNIRFKDKGKDFHFTERVRAFTIDDFKSLFSKAGLLIEKTYGDYNLRPFQVEDSSRLILVAGKNA